MLKGFSVILNLKLRVEMGGEQGTRTMLRVLMNKDGESSGGDGWLATEGAGWEDLERIEVNNNVSSGGSNRLTEAVCFGWNGGQLVDSDGSI